MFTMENCFYVLISQAVRCLKDPSIMHRDKQRLKQELSSELVRCSCSNGHVYLRNVQVYDPKNNFDNHEYARVCYCTAWIV